METNKAITSFLEYLGAKGYSDYTLLAYEKDVEQMIVFIEQNDIAFLDISVVQAKQYVYFLYNKDYSMVTICRKLSSVRAFYDFLVVRHYLSQNVFAFIAFPKKHQHLPTFLYEQEFDQLIESIDTTSDSGIRDLALFELLFATGLRVSEICQLQLEDVSLEAHILTVLGKGNKQRRVLFNQKSYTVLKQYLQVARPQFQLKQFEKQNHVFLNHLGKPLTPRGVRYLLDKHAFKSPISQKIHPHMLRHSFATFMLDNGANIRMIQELLGHESLSSTQLYTHLSKEKLKQSLNAAHPLAQMLKKE